MFIHDIINMVIEMTEKIINLIETGDYKVPAILFKNYKKLELTEKNLILLTYLINEDKEFNPKKISEDLEMTLPEVMISIDELCSKDFISIKMHESQIKSEYICLESLYKKLAYFITSEPVKKEEKTNIYDLFEKEFSRTLSPIEYELITGWLQADFSEEMISLALKEAVYNGVGNLRYIDKILYEWNKKGIKNAVDLESKNKKEENAKDNIYYEYDWLNEN